MSRVYFHSPSRTVEVRGAERAHLGVFSTDLLMASIGPVFDSLDAPHWTRALLPPDCYLARETLRHGYYGQDLRSFLGCGDRDLIVNGERVGVFGIALNTMCAVGNDVLKFMARVHGQCEIHAWVEGPNRTWLATIIHDGRKLGALRDGMGWEDVLDLLPARDDEPVVMSYSVCEQFPHASLLPSDHPARARDGDAFYDLARAEQWRLCMPELRRQRPSCELRPDGWNHFRFDHGVTAFELHRSAGRGGVA